MKITQVLLAIPSDTCSQHQHKSNKAERQISQTFSRFFQKIIRFLANNSEPRIWQTKTRKGDLIWHIYDPKTGQSEHFSSEQDVRIWIEKQYYR
ncbi:hypothetical protein [Lyngbya sp. PCC 8106]|uniref:hypothetical protein n=1 Tax=Lyngbya sp. (strain PCC 8106) TaxID=313612 RepID=UPI0000EA999A|nr:hypothetical protein [Lyngbya sp. PCC 8106]EAW36895.1 hypothetical protein L8106_27077 [Lyngbya sp. PCC 8106]